MYVFSKSLFQSKYQILEILMKSLSDKKLGYLAYSENDEIPAPNEVAPNSAMVFDNVLGERQHNISKFIAMGRQSVVDVFNLCQTYGQLLKQLYVTMST